MNTEDRATLSILTLNKGGVIEMIDAAFKAIADDIVDANKQAKGPRSVTVKIDFATDDDRVVSAVVVNVSEKLAGTDPLKSRVVIGRDRSGGTMTEIQDPHQLSLPSPVSIVKGGAL